MIQFLTKTQAGCRRGFSCHLLHRITTLIILTAVALIFEDRRRFGAAKPGRSKYRREQNLISRALRNAFGQEAHFGIEPGMKHLDWGLTHAVDVWYGGGTLEQVEETTESTMGDVCRIFRMSIQLLRNMRRAIDDPSWDLCDKLEEAMQMTQACPSGALSLQD